jgi:DNA-directed RNA polymerase specialized sigma24 family protein
MGFPRQSFEEFVQAHAGDLLRTACLITWDDAEAEDLVQECLLRVAKRWRRVRGMQLPLAYARRILINLALPGFSR